VVLDQTKAERFIEVGEQRYPSSSRDRRHQQGGDGPPVLPGSGPSGAQAADQQQIARRPSFRSEIAAGTSSRMRVAFGSTARSVDRSARGEAVGGGGAFMEVGAVEDPTGASTMTYDLTTSRPGAASGGGSKITSEARFRWEPRSRPAGRFGGMLDQSYHA
jgi:hypothetical protein